MLRFLHNFTLKSTICENLVIISVGEVAHIIFSYVKMEGRKWANLYASKLCVWSIKMCLVFHFIIHYQTFKITYRSIVHVIYTYPSV